MRLADAVRQHKARPGFRVDFEVRENGMLRSDFTPERDEEPFPTEEIAWAFAEYLNRVAPPHIVNIYVVDGTWSPVPGYREREMRRYPSGTP